ncbi:hypothetical protein E6C60_3560 [Paenibacillus algicola]|uniref:Uncharacterized protein n=1 Tax=Paenibacillus algicola TaxID=2565926 RepID=A0A4P8XQX8_9BACL|nr:hypothetical protein E6C60_3560 [Paenibacillus algicola]
MMAADTKHTAASFFSCRMFIVPAPPFACGLLQSDVYSLTSPSSFYPPNL